MCMQPEKTLVSLCIYDSGLKVAQGFVFGLGFVKKIFGSFLFCNHLVEEERADSLTFPVNI